MMFSDTAQFQHRPLNRFAMITVSPLSEDKKSKAMTKNGFFRHTFQTESCESFLMSIFSTLLNKNFAVPKV